MTGTTRARLLFVGDIHLGRRPTRLPERLGEYGIDPAELTPAATWRRTVDHACALAEEPEGLAALVLAGDVIESLEDRFGAFPHLESGVRRLVEAGVPVYGVAGNHDVQALPRLADRIPEFHLLGRGGRWERVSPCPGVDLVGWSFPQRVVRENPLADYAPASSDGAVTLGVLHCDLDGGHSSYAPVTRGELEAAPADAWLLGHVHAPSSLEGPRPIGYLGSLVGLDPGEPGPHGPWLVEVDAAGRVRARQLALAPLRWERAVLRLDEAALCEAAGDPASLADALQDRATRLLRELRERAQTGGLVPRVMGVRLAIEGTTRFREAVRDLCADPAAWPVVSAEDVHLFTEKIEDRTRPAVDLEALARGTDPPALLARRLLEVEQGRFDEALARRLEGVRDDVRFRDLSEEARREDARATRERTLRVGLATLESLLAQRSSPEAAP
ncbi:MAG: metallophosphoesterase family protein [Myxococcota bacterium]